MALHSISDRSLDVVQALLILLTWPLKEEIAADSNLPLAGAMILMARRAGLHRPAHGSDFVRARGNLTHRGKCVPYRIKADDVPDFRLLTNIAHCRCCKPYHSLVVLFDHVSQVCGCFLCVVE